MEKKKLKLSISGNSKKTFSSIEEAKSKSKNTVVIEKKNSKFAGKSQFSRQSNNNIKTSNNISSKPNNFSRPSTQLSSDFEKRKLAEQRATRRLKGEVSQKDNKSNRVNLVPLNDLAQEVLKDCPEICESFFTSTGNSPIQQSSKAKRRLDIAIEEIKRKNKINNVFNEPWVNHDLRRTITTELRKMKFNRSTCSAILNHAEQGITAKNYDQYDLLDEKMKAMTAWNSYLKKLICQSSNIIHVDFMHYEF